MAQPWSRQAADVAEQPAEVSRVARSAGALAVARREDPDAPRGLATVTVTR